MRHIGVNFRSGDGPRKTVSENSLAEARAKNIEANVDPFKGFAFRILPRPAAVFY